MLRRRLAMLGVFGALGVSIVVACSDDVPPPAAAAPDATSTGNAEEGVCPTNAPAAGDSCLLPNGTTCAFFCGSVIARCLGGAWLYSGNPATTLACPKDFPVADSVCPACWSPDASCIYGSVDCSAEDASANTTVAICPSGKWVLSTYPCGILDAGADVQRDSAPDAD